MLCYIFHVPTCKIMQNGLKYIGIYDKANK